MQSTSTRLLHDPHIRHNQHHSFPQPPPFSFEDVHHHATHGPAAAAFGLPFDLPSTATTSSSSHHTAPSSSASLAVDDLFPPPAFDSMNFFSSNETDDMLEFLRDFDTSDPWEFNPILPSSMPVYPGEPLVEDQVHLYSSNHHAQDVDQSGIADSSSVASVHSSTGTILPPDSQTTPQGHHHHQTSPPASASALHHSYSSGGLRQQQQSSQPSTSGSATTGSSPPGNHILSSQAAADLRPKLLLSAPQKRMNHVKSEKRRRDTIRDGYLTLTKLLSPSGPGAEQLAIPRRGRPKGSGRAGTGKKTGKGKSGVLFRAVEYIRFMEEGCDSLEHECQRLERLVLAASSQQQQQQQQQVVQQQGYPNLQYGHAW